MMYLSKNTAIYAAALTMTLLAPSSALSQGMKEMQGMKRMTPMSKGTMSMSGGGQRRAAPEELARFEDGNRNQHR